MKKDIAIEKRIEELISQMTVKEKVGQLNQIYNPIEDDETIFSMLRRGEIGAFLMANSAHAGHEKTRLTSIEFLHKLQRIAVEESRLGIPVLYGRDVIHGHNTVLPVPLALAASFHEKLVKECYRDVAREAARDGIQWTYAPMLDIARDPRWGRCIESPGEDPYVGMQMAKAVTEGFQGDDPAAEDSVAACAKHYIGYGAAEGGRDYHKCEITDYTLRNYYLRAFRSAVESGVQTVMNSFNEIGGQPVASSRYLLTDVLKKELGFDGFVVSDWAAVQQLIDQGVAEDRKAAAKSALCAGLDMDMVDNCYIDCIEALVNEGKIRMETLDESVRRVLRVKFRLGLFQKPYIPNYFIDRRAHEKRARELAADCMVLLKNNGHVLPLSKDSRVALIGPMAKERASLLGSWSLDGEETDVVSLYDGMCAAAGMDKIEVSPNDLYDEGLMHIACADAAVLCLGESQRVTGEANSLACIEVPAEQLNLAKRARRAGKPVVAVMCFGRPVAMEELEPYCDAILYAWHPGTQAGNAVADVLYGAVNPCGKLPMTMPRTTGQIPIYYNTPSSGRPVNGYYGQQGCYHDYPGTPLYPFGYGLSYTTFCYENCRIEQTNLSLEELKGGKTFTIDIDVCNTGELDGKEIVELYIRDRTASMTRPLRELKGYRKILIKAGEKQTVRFEIGFDDLAFYNAQKAFVVEKGIFELYIGKDCYAAKTAELTVC